MGLVLPTSTWLHTKALMAQPCKPGGAKTNVSAIKSCSHLKSDDSSVIKIPIVVFVGKQLNKHLNAYVRR